MEATGRLLGSIPLLHVIGSVAAHRAVPDADDDLAFPAAHLPAQLLADAASACSDHLRVPNVEPRLAAHDLPGVHDQLMLSPVRDLARDPSV